MVVFTPILQKSSSKDVSHRVFNFKYIPFLYLIREIDQSLKIHEKLHFTPSGKELWVRKVSGLLFNLLHISKVMIILT